MVPAARAAVVQGERPRVSPAPTRAHAGSAARPVYTSQSCAGREDHRNERNGD